MDEIADPGGNPCRRLAGPVDPRSHIDIGDSRWIHRILVLEALHLLEDFELFGSAAAIEPSQTGTDADDRDDPIGRLEGRVEREHAAHRVADERRAADALRIEHGQEIVDPRELDVLGGRSADPALVVADGSIAGRVQERRHRVPGAQIGDPRMEEHDRRSGTLVDDQQAAAGNLGVASGGADRPGHPSRAIGSRSIVRTWRVRPASVRTSAAGITPVAIFSITAASPA